MARRSTIIVSGNGAQASVRGPTMGLGCSMNDVRMSFRITGLDPQSFRHLFGLSEAALAQQRVRRYVADAASSYPDRVELRDAQLGETVLLLNYTHQAGHTPYYACHAIFVREGAAVAYAADDEIPPSLRTRMISLRAFDPCHMMIDADLVDGCALERAIERLLDDPKVSYLHAHYAKRGCYAARVERA